MKLLVIRHGFTLLYTEGGLLLDGRWYGYTLEDPVREGPKIPGKTAIPAGRYRLTVERSPRFSARAGQDVFLPRLHDVPGFDGVLIHGGNTAEDSLGCILCGGHRPEPGVIQGSLSKDLTMRLQNRSGPHEIEIREARPWS
jgi:hypothetical protein